MNNPTATTTATTTAPAPTFVGEYMGQEYYEFTGLRGYWNTTFGWACLYAGPCGRVKEPLTAAEVAALETAAAAANL
jgi:hypothetical protein